jgi:hypothetical protein
VQVPVQAERSPPKPAVRPAVPPVVAAVVPPPARREPAPAAPIEFADEPPPVEKTPTLSPVERVRAVAAAVHTTPKPHRPGAFERFVRALRRLVGR